MRDPDTGSGNTGLGPERLGPRGWREVCAGRTGQQGGISFLHRLPHNSSSAGRAHAGSRDSRFTARGSQPFWGFAVVAHCALC